MTNASVARNNARLVVQAIQEIVIENRIFLFYFILFYFILFYSTSLVLII